MCFHGTAEQNVAAICREGLDPKRRCGQALGPGEYFATNADVSLSYCKGGRKMLVFAVLMERGKRHGVQGAGQVIISSRPEHQLPLFVVTFRLSAQTDRAGAAGLAALAALSLPSSKAGPQWASIAAALRAGGALQPQMMAALGGLAGIQAMGGMGLLGQMMGGQPRALPLGIKPPPQRAPAPALPAALAAPPLPRARPFGIKPPQRAPGAAPQALLVAPPPPRRGRGFVTLPGDGKS
jgi:hypothetical protein